MVEKKVAPQIISFKTQKEFEKWLDKNYCLQEGIWLRYFKKASRVKTVTYAEALEVALCYGWIDGQAKKYDEDSWLQKFTPRRQRSIWSKRNIEHVERLIKEGQMKSAGRKEMERAKEDGRWDNAYDSPSKMEIPADFLQELKKDKKAETFFSTLNRSNKYAIVWRLQTAKKPETRERRLQKILKMLKDDQKFH